MFVGSWNVGDTSPPADCTELAEWLRPGEFDLYAITLQEADQRVRDYPFTSRSMGERCGNS